MLRMTGLGAGRSGEVAFDRFRALLEAAVRSTSDLDDGSPRHSAMDDTNEDPVAFVGLALSAACSTSAELVLNTISGGTA